MFQLVAVASCSVTEIPLRSLSPFSLLSSVRYLYAFLIPLPSLLFWSLQSQLSASPHTSDSNPLIIIMTLCQTQYHYVHVPLVLRGTGLDARCSLARAE